MSSEASVEDLEIDLEPIERIVVIGTGFVGLPLALQLASNGIEVVGVDIDQNIVEAINRQDLNLNEAKLNRLLESDVVGKNLIARTEPTEGDAFVISVPTPMNERSKKPDLVHVENAIDSIVPYLRGGDLVNIESTVPPLACETDVANRLSEAGFRPGEDVQLAHSPERILPGNVFEEIIHNDRVIGGIDRESAGRASLVYEPFLEGDIYHTDLLSAELCKLMENTYRDVNIALANEFALIGDDLGIDITSVVELANHHPRVDILRPGIGVGGHCLPVDPWFLNEADPEHTNLITTARRINEMMPGVTASRIRRAIADLDSPPILALGATYKPNTYDIRNSPARLIVDELRKDGYDIEHYDRRVEGMGYESLDSLLSRIDVEVVVQLVPHAETVEEITKQQDWLTQNDLRVIQFGMGSSPTHPNVIE